MAFEDWPFADTWSLHGNKEIVSRYEILERIGEGTFGEVYRARRREDNTIVALKEIHDSDSSYREVKALLLLDHPNVVKLYEYFVQGSNMVLVLEYLPSNLYEVVRASKGELSEGEVKGWTVQILQGLAACHAAAIVHRDIKPTNLLIAKDGTLKIADFGQARVLRKDLNVNEEDVYESEVADEDVAASQVHNVTEICSPRILPICRGSIPLSAPKIGGVACSDAEDVQLKDEISAASGGLYRMENHGTRGEGAVLIFNEPEHLSQYTNFGRRECGQRNFEKQQGSDKYSVPLNISDQCPIAGTADEFTSSVGVEEMVRNGTGLDGLGVPGVGRNQTKGWEGQDPSCCGWFCLENAEGRGSMKMSLSVLGGVESAVQKVSDGSDKVCLTEQGNDSSSGESEGNWKKQYGIQNDWIVTKDNMEIYSTEVPSGKGEHDILRKLQRFLRKRTNRLSAEEKMVLHDNPVGIADKIQMDGRNICKETSRDFLFHSPSHTRVLPEESAATHGICEGGSWSPLYQGSCSAERETSENMNGLSAVAGLPDGRLGKQGILSSQSGGVVKVDKDFSAEDKAQGTHRDVKLEKVVQESGTGGKAGNRVVLNGPLREMANASGHEFSAIKELSGNDAYQHANSLVEKIDSSSEISHGNQIFVSKEKSKRELKDGSGKSNKKEKFNNFLWDVGKGWGTHNTTCSPADDEERPSFPQNRTSKFETDKMDKRCEGQASCVREMRQERLDGNLGNLSADRDVGTSWEQMEEHDTSLSDAEGTRWFGAPQFRYSYMEARKADTSGGKGTGDSRRVGSANQEEWEDGSEGGAYNRNGGFSQDFSDRCDDGTEDGSDFTTMVGTRWYKAPELLYGATKYGTEIDVWSVGCIFGELLWGKPLFPGINDIDQLSRLVRILGSPSESDWPGVSLLPDYNKICFVDDRSPLTLRNYLLNLTENSLQFLQKLLTYDPMQRPTPEESLKDEYLLKEPRPYPPGDLTVPIPEKCSASDEEWGEWKDPGSPFSDFEILG